MNINSVKDLGDFYLVTYNGDIKSNIPKNPTNRDYRKVEEWLKDNELTVDTLEEKKDKLFALNKQKKAQARDKGIEITVGDRSYLVNEKTVLELAILKALGRKPAPWKRCRQ